MVNPDHAIAVWNDLIAAMPEPDRSKARQLMVLVQSRLRQVTTTEAPDTSEPSLPPAISMTADAFSASIAADPAMQPEPEAQVAPAVSPLQADDMPNDLHELLSMFH